MILHIFYIFINKVILLNTFNTHNDYDVLKLYVYVLYVPILSGCWGIIANTYGMVLCCNYKYWHQESPGRRLGSAAAKANP